MRPPSAVLERVRERLAFALTTGRVPSFTVSFGLASSIDADTFDEVVAVADHALLDAKASGRDRIVVGSTIVSDDPDIPLRSARRARGRFGRILAACSSNPTCSRDYSPRPLTNVTDRAAARPAVTPLDHQTSAQQARRGHEVAAEPHAVAAVDRGRSRHVWPGRSSAPL